MAKAFGAGTLVNSRDIYVMAKAYGLLLVNSSDVHLVARMNESRHYEKAVQESRVLRRLPSAAKMDSDGTLDTNFDRSLSKTGLQHWLGEDKHIL